ncbi:hypothetical protein KQI84_02760 [bacterium]|nr:hypothetical protein [bacterium]
MGAVRECLALCRDFMRRRPFPALLAFSFLTVYSVQAQDTVISTNTNWTENTYNMNSLTVQSGAVLTIDGGSTVNVTSGISVTGNSFIVCKTKDNTAQVGGLWAGIGVTFTAGSLSVDSGSTISADGTGYINEKGPGAGGYDFYRPSGAGFGGRGSNGNDDTAGLTYGSIHEPTSPGSGGGHCYYRDGEPGGGAMRFTVSGTATINGSLSADGLSSNQSSNTVSGAGSGGSIWVDCGTLAGSGTISADGGSAAIPDYNAGAGGGGRVALYMATNNFSGTASAYGGQGLQNGGAGTVYTKLDAASYGVVAINNNGLAQQWVTPLGSTPQFELDVANAGMAFPEPGVALISLDVQSGGLISHDPNATALDFSVVNDAMIGVGGMIDLDGRGYPNETGTGAGGYDFYYPSGGGYGGRGSDGNDSGGMTYGSIHEPTDFGSGGGHGYYLDGEPGGGAVKLQVGGTLTVDGAISVDGLDSQNASNTVSGAGSGGSVWIICSTLEGLGEIGANGGASTVPSYFAGAGGGGRIAIYAATDNFGGQVLSLGGEGKQGGGAGTIYRKLDSATYGTVDIDNNDLPQQWVTPLGDTPTYHLRVANAGMAFPEPGISLASLEVLQDGIISHDPNATALEFSVMNDATIYPGGTVDLDGRGHISEEGLGAGAYDFYFPSGGGHGGRGSSGNLEAGGLTYGSFSEPTAFGSGGGRPYTEAGEPGGGAMKLTVGGTLTVNGIITSDGDDSTQYSNTASGAGAGGSLWLICSTLAGDGEIAANGGQANIATVFSGAGGGGRVAAYMDTDNFTGVITAYGGEGLQNGGAGTVYRKLTSETYGEVVVDNNGLFQEWVTLITTPTLTNLTLADAGMAFPQPGMSLVNLTINSGGILSHDPNADPLEFSVLNDMTVNSGGSVDLDGRGYPNETGAGAGGYDFYYGSGGGYGGRGSNGYDDTAGLTYGSITQPVDYGSGGGHSYYKNGSPGGGAMKVNVGGTLTIDGIVSANGSEGIVASNTRSGAGSGGSLWLNCATLAGSGQINANGADGDVSAHLGGAGGGGRIAVYANTNNYIGEVTAFGGDGQQGAGAGTIYTKLTGDAYGTILVANNGLAQQWVTPLEQEDISHLVLADDGRAYPVHGLQVQSLDIQTSGIISHDPGETLDFTVLTDATIQEDGLIDIDGMGHIGDAGPGKGSYDFYNGSGGGYGGQGGQGGSGAPGGDRYGSWSQPTDIGSGGGRSYYEPGAAGGGAVKLEVYGTLTNNGSITAKGLGGIQASNTLSGGGSGGSVFLGIGGFAGSGVIDVTGGDGGGGGGGGRVAIYCGGTNSFPMSNIDVSGGTGNVDDGDPGTIEVGTALFEWIRPSRYLIHDVETIEWSAFGVDRPNTEVEVTAKQSGVENSLGSGFAAAGTSTLDTTSYADGPIELRAYWSLLDGTPIGDLGLAASINNSSDIFYAGGEITGAVTWPSDKIIVVEEDLHIADTGMLTIPAGVIVKFVYGVGVTVEGTLDAPATAGSPILMTSLRDDAAGGDTNLDGTATHPLPGDWHGIQALGAGTVNVNEYVEMRYLQMNHEGTLLASETWLGNSVHHVTGFVTVPSGTSLVIEPGAVIKFDPAADLGIEVQASATLNALGTIAQPITFTSSRDDSVGGDTNGDGDESVPGVGDWRWLHASGGSINLQHVNVLYGGGTSDGNWNNTAVIRTSNGGEFGMRECVVRHTFFDAVYLYGSGSYALLVNCILDDADRGVMNESGSDVEIIGCLINNMRWGVFPHGGTLSITNSIVSNCSDRGFGICCGSPQPDILYCNIWNPDGDNFNGVTDVIGTNGNISANPRFKDPTRYDYRLNYISPCIDAADTTAGMDNDFAGAPRYDDPRTPNTGVESLGVVADIGPYEFVETADSDIDVSVSDVLGPSSAIAGESVPVTWTVNNVGMGTVFGPWRDRVWVVPDGGGDPVMAGDQLVGSGVTLGPGQSYTAESLVRVPGALPGDYNWRVELNARKDIFEGQNYGNNTADSTSLVALDIPVLPVDGDSDTRLIGAEGDSLWYQFDAAPGQDVLVTLDSALDTGVMELYLGDGRVPTRNDFDARQVETSSADVSTVAPAVDPGTWYVFAYANKVTGGPRAVTLQASELGFELTGMSPPQAGNTGHVVFNVRGGGLTSAATFNLIGPDATVYDSTLVEILNPAVARVGFDLYDLPTGSYDLRVLYGDTFTLPDALTIVEGQRPDLWVDIVGRNQVRYRAEETYTVHYGNRANVDSPPAVIGFEAPGNWTVTNLSDIPMATFQTDDRSVAEFVFSLSRIPANSSGSFQIAVASQDFGNFTLDAWIRTIGVAPPSYALPDPDPEITLSAVIDENVPGEYVIGRILIDDGTEVSSTVYELHITEVTEPVPISMTETDLGGGFTLTEMTLTVPKTSSSRIDGTLYDKISWLWTWGSDAKSKYDNAKKAYDYGNAAYNKVTQDALTECLKKKGCLQDTTYGNLKRFANNVIYFKIATDVISAPDQTGWVGAAIEPVAGLIDSGWLGILWRQRFELEGCGLYLLESKSVSKDVIAFCKDHSEPPNPPCCDNDGGGDYGDDSSLDTESGGGKDPNEKHGPNGDYILSRDPILYTVMFENMAEAPWPAQVVTVTDQLDVNAFDLDTLELGDMSFGSHKLTPPAGRSDYVGDVDLRPDKDMVVRIEGALDKETGVLSWIFSSLDPETLNVIDDPVDGFLPPNVNPPEGDGIMYFTITPKADLPSGTVIKNKATIVFDLNDSIITNETVHTLDVIAPTSEIDALPEMSTQTPVTLSITGSDDSGGSGIDHYEIFMSTDYGPFSLYATTTEATYDFNEPSGHLYSFYSVARDVAGNRETSPSTADAHTIVMTASGVLDHLLGTAEFEPTGIVYADRNDDHVVDVADMWLLIE